METTFSLDALHTTPTRAARRLLGAVLVHQAEAGTTSGFIVETEAYCETDPASHTFAGPTPRNRIMFGGAGHAYVYFTYGVHWCFNVVTGREGRGEAALIRALQPITGLALMAQRRRVALSGESAGLRLLDDRQTEQPVQKVLVSLTSGPARLTQAMGLTGEAYGTDLLALGSALRLQTGVSPVRDAQVVASRRIGIRKATEKRWRFHIIGNPYVSRP